MVWRDLLQKPEGETLVAPWVGMRYLHTYQGTWYIEGRLPEEFGWVTFKLFNRKAKIIKMAEPSFESLRNIKRGFLIGDHLIPDETVVVPDIRDIGDFEQVYLIEPGLPRFVRISAGRFYEGGSLIYQGLEMPLGPEEDVQNAYLDGAESLDHIAGVVPALDAAFRIEVWRRKEAERLRLEVEQKRREEEERLAREERRRQLLEELGDGKSRREMAQHDFREAARAALEVGNAVYLDHRQAYNRGEFVVQFRYQRRRFECTCDRNLRIIDAGICLIDHATGRRDDNLLTLESLPPVIGEAIDTGKLVVFRHVR